MKNILRSRPRTVANRPTSGGWGNKKCFFPADSGRPGANRLSAKMCRIVSRFLKLSCNALVLIMQHYFDICTRFIRK